MLFADGHVKAIRISEARKQTLLSNSSGTKGAWFAAATVFE
jgi:hypothetical protein